MAMSLEAKVMAAIRIIQRSMLLNRVGCVRRSGVISARSRPGGVAHKAATELRGRSSAELRRGMQVRYQTAAYAEASACQGVWERGAGKSKFVSARAPKVRAGPALHARRALP